MGKRTCDSFDTYFMDRVVCMTLNFDNHYHHIPNLTSCNGPLCEAKLNVKYV